MPLQTLKKLKIAVVNLMPNQFETQLMWTTVLKSEEPDITIDFIRMKSHKASIESQKINKAYQTLDDVKNNFYHGMIITGAPVEKMDFEQVDYWNEFQTLLHYSKEHASSTLFVCWAAQAALYSRYGIEKKIVNQKIFGIYNNFIYEHGLLLKGFGTEISVPQSRYSGNNLEQIKNVKQLQVDAFSSESGSYIIEDYLNKSIYISGHPEYDLTSLEKEFLRDQQRGLPISIPQNYYVNNNPEGLIYRDWKRHSHIFFQNWINLCKQSYKNLQTAELVSKFGGTSLADANQFKKVKKIIEQERCTSVVVSAPGKRFPKDEKVTDLLVQCFEAINKREHGDDEQIFFIEQLLEEIRNRFLALCKQLKLSVETAQKVNVVIEEILHSKDRDYIISRGEFLNGIIMAEYLSYTFIDASEIIFFNQNGLLDERKTYHAINQKLKRAQRVVVPGFYGSSSEGGIKTFARGGSDITGSIIARGLKADLYQNWSDVDGVMTADPNLDHTATPILHMTYEELSQIAKEGAGIFHLDAVKYVKEAGIPLHIKNTNCPEQEGTLITEEGEKIW